MDCIFLVTLFVAGLDAGHSFACYETHNNPITKTIRPYHTSSSSSLCAKKSKKKSSGGKNTSTGVKGFGSGMKSSSSSSSASVNQIDRSRKTLQFYDFIEKNKAGANLKRVAIGTCTIKSPDSDENIDIRGVVALRDIRKGEDILSIPYELALNLGREGNDPTLPAYMLLQEICRHAPSEAVLNKGLIDYSPYIAMLPEFDGPDCLSSTDFFSDEALDALQFPVIKEETLLRRKLTQARFDRDVQPMIDIGASGGNNALAVDTNNEPITFRHLQWAVWLITSRVLTVQGADGSGQAFRLMIPFIDMCNHDRNSPHILSGRAVPGGILRVVAGADIKAGEQVNICYGGGVAGNDRFIQDYGFLDWSGDNDGAMAYDIVTKKLLKGNQGLTFQERDEAMEALSNTSILEDQKLLNLTSKSDLKAAISYRIGIKKSLERVKV